MRDAVDSVPIGRSLPRLCENGSRLPQAGRSHRSPVSGAEAMRRTNRPALTGVNRKRPHVACRRAWTQGCAAHTERRHRLRHPGWAPVDRGKVTHALIGEARGDDVRKGSSRRPLARDRLVLETRECGRVADVGSGLLEQLRQARLLLLLVRLHQRVAGNSECESGRQCDASCLYCYRTYYHDLMGEGAIPLGLIARQL